MDKRKEANQRVRRSITQALFDLMQSKSLAEIHITEVIRAAGVARASFYRNYASKEDVLTTLIREVLADFRQGIQYEDGNFYTYGNLLRCFQYFQKYRSYILDLRRSGFGFVLLEELNLFHESIEGTMPAASVQKYQLYMYTGALFNTAMVWLTGDQKLPAESLAEFFLHTGPWGTETP